VRSGPERPLAVGEAAPDFRALSHIGYSVGLRDFGDRPVLVQICPNGFELACAERARSLRSQWLTLNRRLAMALFVVPLGYVESRAFASAEELPFLVLADSERKLTHAFGVHESSAIGFVIGPNLTVARVIAGESEDEYVRELTSALP
jgi:peroxiredoxin